ncbi:MAG: DUF3848 domain-containing protein [Clostridia bacterium]|nr:DUF3848 domain-containing protein [Clostridia bacterium]
MNRQEFNKKIQNEYENFMEKTLSLSPEEIFEKAIEITIKTFLCDYLQDNGALNEENRKTINNLGDNILDAFYNIFAENDFEFYYLDICDDIVSDYLSLFNHDENDVEVELD